MPDFFKNNTNGFSAALLVGLIATAFTGGLGIIPLLLGALAFALVGGLMGKDENGLLSGFFKKDAPAAPATTDAPQAQPGQTQQPPAPAAAPPTPSPAADPDMAVPFQVLDASGKSVLPRHDDRDVIAIANESGQKDVFALGNFSTDKKTFQVDRFTTIAPDGSTLTSSMTTPITLPVHNGKVDVAILEDMIQNNRQQAKDIAAQRALAAPREFAVTQDKSYPEFSNATIGQTDVGGKPYDVVMQGIKNGDQIHFGHAVLQGADGSKLTDATGNTIAFPLGNTGPLPVTNNQVTLIGGPAKAAAEEAAKNIKAVYDAKQVVILDIKGNDTPKMRQFLRDLDQQLQEKDLLRKELRPEYSDPSLTGEPTGKILHRQIAIAGNFNADDTFTVKKVARLTQDMPIKYFGDSSPSEPGRELFYLQTEQPSPPASTELRTASTASVQQLVDTISKPETIDYVRSTYGVQISAQLKNRFPDSIVEAQQRAEAAPKQEMLSEPTGMAAPQKPVQTDMERALEQFKNSGTDLLAGGDLNKKLPQQQPAPEQQKGPSVT